MNGWVEGQTGRQVSADGEGLDGEKLCICQRKNGRGE